MSKHAAKVPQSTQREPPRTRSGSQNHQNKSIAGVTRMHKKRNSEVQNYPATTIKFELAQLINQAQIEKQNEYDEAVKVRQELFEEIMN